MLPALIVRLPGEADIEKSPAGAGFTVKIALVEALPYVAMMMILTTPVVAVTSLVLMVESALVAPAKTVTVAGTVATKVLLLESVTFVFVEGAALRVTVPVDELPPTTLLGLA